MNISALEVQGKDKPEANSTITATCVATTFVLLDKPGAGSKPGARALRPALRSTSHARRRTSCPSSPSWERRERAGNGGPSGVERA